jgi:hypothetical protein
MVRYPMCFCHPALDAGSISQEIKVMDPGSKAGMTAVFGRDDRCFWPG